MQINSKLDMMSGQLMGAGHFGSSQMMILQKMQQAGSGNLKVRGADLVSQLSSLFEEYELSLGKAGNDKDKEQVVYFISCWSFSMNIFN